MMGWRQVKPFNQSAAGTKSGYCLQNVRLGYGIAAKYPNAIGAWNATQQHRDRNIPAGVDVPLFYSYKEDGHVNVRLADGRVWSDGNIYSSLSAYESTHPAVKYLGWGESINDVRIIEYVSAQGGTMLTEAQVQKLYLLLRGTNGDPGGVKNYTGKSLDFVLNDMTNSQELKDRKTLKIWEYNDLVAKANRVSELETEVDNLRKLQNKPTAPSDPASEADKADAAKWRTYKQLRQELMS